MRILHIVPSYKPAYIYGGPIESVARLCEGLSEQGHEIEVYTTTANGEKELDIQPGSTIIVDGVKVTYFKRITKDPTHVSPDLWKRLFLSVKQYDVVHIHSWWNILVMVAAQICLMKRVKVIIAPRGMLSRYIFNSGSSKAKKLIHQLFGRNILKQSYYHATADAEAVECRQLISGWKGFVLPNLIALPEKIEQRAPNKVFTLLFMSRIHPKKGLELLFEAVKDLDIDFELKIAGTGDDDYISQLKIYAEKLGLSKRIIWLGWKSREEKFKELANADLFVLVSLNENFANVVIESLHAGTPVFISQDVALSDFIDKHDLGWVTSLDPGEVKRKLKDACSDSHKLNAVRRISKGVIRENFSEKQLIGRYAHEYERAISGKTV